MAQRTNGEKGYMCDVAGVRKLVISEGWVMLGDDVFTKNGLLIMM